MQPPGFILASASPRRLSLLAQIGFVPDAVVTPEIDETPRKDEKAEAYVRRLAREKAEAGAVLRGDLPLLSADTTVAVGTRLLGKPVDEADAARMLTLLSGRRHRVTTGVAWRLPDGRVRQREVTTQVMTKRLSQEEIALYLASGEWRGKAGGYGIQGLFEAFVQAVHGSYSNVVGLPLRETRGLMLG